MTHGDDLTLGEMQRSLQRIEVAVARLSEKVEPMGALGIRMTNAETNLVRLDHNVDEVTKQANRIAGAGALLAVLVGLLPLPWKR